MASPEKKSARANPASSSSSTKGRSSNNLSNNVMVDKEKDANYAGRNHEKNGGEVIEMIENEEDIPYYHRVMCWWSVFPTFSDKRIVRAALLIHMNVFAYAFSYNYLESVLSPQLAKERGFSSTTYLVYAKSSFGLAQIIASLMAGWLIDHLWSQERPGLLFAIFMICGSSLSAAAMAIVVAHPDIFGPKKTAGSEIGIFLFFKTPGIFMAVGMAAHASVAKLLEEIQMQEDAKHDPGTLSSTQIAERKEVSATRRVGALSKIMLVYALAAAIGCILGGVVMETTTGKTVLESPSAITQCSVIAFLCFMLGLVNLMLFPYNKLSKKQEVFEDEENDVLVGKDDTLVGKDDTTSDTRSADDIKGDVESATSATTYAAKSNPKKTPANNDNPSTSTTIDNPQQNDSQGYGAVTDSAVQISPLDDKDTEDKKEVTTDSIINDKSEGKKESNKKESNSICEWKFITLFRRYPSVWAILGFEILSGAARMIFAEPVQWSIVEHTTYLEMGLVGSLFFIAPLLVNLILIPLVFKTSECSRTTTEDIDHNNENGSTKNSKEKITNIDVLDQDNSNLDNSKEDDTPVDPLLGETTTVEAQSIMTSKRKWFTVIVVAIGGAMFFAYAVTARHWKKTHEIGKPDSKDSILWSPLAILILLASFFSGAGEIVVQSIISTTVPGAFQVAIFGVLHAMYGILSMIIPLIAGRMLDGGDGGRERKNNGEGDFMLGITAGSLAIAAALFGIMIKAI